MSFNFLKKNKNKTDKDKVNEEETENVKTNEDQMDKENKNVEKNFSEEGEDTILNGFNLDIDSLLSQKLFILKEKKYDNFLSFYPDNVGKPNLIFSNIKSVNKEGTDNDCQKIARTLYKKHNVTEKDNELISNFINKNFVLPEKYSGNIIFINNFLNLKEQGNQHFNKSLIFFSDKESINEVKQNIEDNFDLSLEILSFTLSDFNHFKESYLLLEEEHYNILTKQNDYIDFSNNFVPKQKLRLELLRLKEKQHMLKIEKIKKEEKLKYTKLFIDEFVDKEKDVKTNKVNIEKINQLKDKIVHNISSLKNEIFGLTNEIDKLN